MLELQRYRTQVPRLYERFYRYLLLWVRSSKCSKTKLSELPQIRSGKHSTGCDDVEGVALGRKLEKSATNSSQYGAHENITTQTKSTRPTIVSSSTNTLNLPHLLTKSKRHARSIKYFKNKRIFTKHCISTISNNFIKNDPRPYAEIILASKPMHALLDSGASVSVLGKGSLQFLAELNIKFCRLNSFIKTADGTRNNIEGYVWLPVTFGSKTEKIKFCIVPSLESSVYLGIDFWEIFKIVPTCNISELQKPEESNSHVLSKVEQEERDRVVHLFPSFLKDGLGKTKLYEHEIIVIKDTKPIKQRYYPISPAVQQCLYEEIDRMLDLGVIEVSKSAWSSPVTLVRKPNGRTRLCLDARKLNSVTEKDAYPLPIIDGLLGRLSETKYITGLDLKDAFWQIPLAESSRDKTAFTVPGRPLYQFRVMPFGLCNAAQSMCRLMHLVIPHELQDRVFVYLDDLLVITATLREHFELLELVADLLRTAGLTINIEKSNFIMREIRYLGYLVGEEGLRPDPNKIDAIINLPAPENVKQTRRLLGMAGWYRRFILNFASITAPITNCLKKGKFCWTHDAQDAFEHLKILLTTAPVLVNASYDQPFFIRCDASTEGVGAVLYQKDEELNERPIAYMSQKLNKAQKNYSVTELECLAAILAIKKFRPYVEGHNFTLITDHASLKWLMGQRDLSGRLARWSLKLQGYQFTIEHQKGRDNVVPDMLSRIYCDSSEEHLSSITKFNALP